MSSSRSIARIYPDANERFGESWHNYDALMVRPALSLSLELFRPLLSRSC